MSQPLAWRIVIALSIVQAGAYIGTESAAQEYSHYFWDLTGYVLALDTEHPYRAVASFPYLYPPASIDLFTLARSHLFELLSISYVAAVALFFGAFVRLTHPRRAEWLCAITAMGGMGVVSLQSGNVAILLNFTLLAVTIQAALGSDVSRQMLPMVIAGGALIKPQFAIYLGLLLFVEPSRRVAIVKIAAAGAAVVGVHAAYMVFRPFAWDEYSQGVVKRMLVERDWGWGPAALGTHLSSGAIAPYVGYVAGLAGAAALCGAAWKRTAGAVPKTATVCLAFVVLSLGNPRLPLYDLYAAGIARTIACGLARDASRLAWALAIALAINVVPWTIDEFARQPFAWPWRLKDMLISHLAGIFILLTALARSGLAPAPR